jgi:hypothetical protein
MSTDDAARREEARLVWAEAFCDEIERVAAMSDAEQIAYANYEDEKPPPRKPHHGRNRLAGILLFAFAAILAGTIVGTQVAHADTVDDAFIATLDEQQITYPTQAYAIRAGHGVCDALDAGTTINDVASRISKESYLGMYDAQYLVGASIGAYCPWHMKEAA